MDDDVPAVPPVTAQEIRIAIFSFPHGSAGGADGLRPPHLKDMTSGLNDVISTELLEALPSLTTHMLNGKVPAGICPFLYGASLAALVKKDGGIRPIAVGCTLRRLTGKVVSMGAQLRPELVGYRAQRGAEAAVHAGRLFLSRNGAECQVLPKLDFKNAFNTIFRGRLLAEAKKAMPQFFHFAPQMYSQPSNLISGD
ncbi:hypothetical protein RvY_17032 [Ramazzottius varieornatus]|uniref:Reverse transcriptase domain-containing protein n=1 Tax=Ramazzottius varieornatus TaxID=947166 RepID=A0A1D1W0N8_RAMVA|nr:hypothetical protein RvY_17032 [Ramazzottius varieornatus]